MKKHEKHIEKTKHINNYKTTKKNNNNTHKTNNTSVRIRLPAPTT